MLVCSFEKSFFFSFFRAEDRTQGLALARQSTLPNPWWWCVPFQQNCGQNWKLGNADFSKSRVNKSGLAHRHKEKKQNKTGFCILAPCNLLQTRPGSRLNQIHAGSFLPPSSEGKDCRSFCLRQTQANACRFLFIYLFLITRHLNER